MDYTFPIIIVFGLGIIAGILATIKIIKRSLEKHRSAVIYLIIGLMLGSLYAIIEGPRTLDVPMPALSLKSFSIVYFALGGIIIAGLQILKNKLDKVKNKW